MYSYEERMKAVQLLIQYNMSYSSVIRELGYPTRNALIRWSFSHGKRGDDGRGGSGFYRLQHYSVFAVCRRKCPGYYDKTAGSIMERTWRKENINKQKIR